jgi:hypothetical protein
VYETGRKHGNDQEDDDDDDDDEIGVTDSGSTAVTCFVCVPPSPLPSPSLPCFLLSVFFGGGGCLGPVEGAEMWRLIADMVDCFADVGGCGCGCGCGVWV